MLCLEEVPHQLCGVDIMGHFAYQAGARPGMAPILYPVRGLDADGRPTQETLKNLGLPELAAKIYK